MNVSHASDHSPTSSTQKKRTLGRSKVAEEYADEHVHDDDDHQHRDHDMRYRSDPRESPAHGARMVKLPRFEVKARPKRGRADSCADDSSVRWRSLGSLWGSWRRRAATTRQRHDH